MLANQRLSIRQFLEAMSDDNRFYASLALKKRFEDVSIEELLAHYVANNEPSMTVVRFEVEDPDNPLFI